MLKPYCLFAFLLLFCLQSIADQNGNYSIGESVSNAIIKRHQPTINQLTNSGWDHANSVVLHGMEKIYLKNGDRDYLLYIKRYADEFIDADGNVNGLSLTLDGLHPGTFCLFLYEQTGEKKYLQAAHHMREHFLGSESRPSAFSKTPDGGYWHKNVEKYRNVMTVDGLYMVYPFLVRYALMTKQPLLLDIAADQILLVSERSFNIKYNLPYHTWNYDKTKEWANPITGTSSQFWSRASGWFAMALVDVLEYFPKSHPKYDELLFLYQSLAQGIKATQNPGNGFWYQVLDAPDEKGNYPEASGTGMMVYALQKGVNLKLLDKSYADAAEKGWRAFKTKVVAYEDGGPQITSFAPGMGSQVDYEAYVAIRPVSIPSPSGKQHTHGYIAALMASSVME